MNIFETKSKYFHNNNSFFARLFSNSAVTIVLILIGLVIMYMGIRAWIGSSDEARLNKNTKEWLTTYGFVYKDLKFRWVHPEDEGQGRSSTRFLFDVSEIYNKDLNEGKPIRTQDRYTVLDHYSELIVTAESYSDHALKVTSLGIVYYRPWRHPKGAWFLVKDSIPNYFQYLASDRKEGIYESIDECILDPEKKGLDTTSIAVSEPEPVAKDTSAAFEEQLRSTQVPQGDEDFFPVDKAKEELRAKVQTQNQNYMVPPPVTQTKKKWDI